ncbi:MAG TPA: pitrilysin family protein [Anaeromyxobacteraceae bacterium]|nr:pitrilysin family protein [Anaeromyxobacteraceae bacterium]
MMRPLLAALLAASLACAAPARTAPPAAGTAPHRNQVPAAGPPPALRVPVPQRFHLPNGLEVRLVEYHRLPIVALHLVLDAGGTHDPAGRPGLAAFAAAMVTEGTRTRSATRISDEVGFIGASLTAGAGFDAAFVSGSSLSRHLPRLLELMADVTANPSFPKQDFARVQDQRRVALVQQRDSPGAVAAKAFAGLFWGSHPYGHWLMGTEASLEAMTPDDLRRFHAQRWRPGGASLVVVGDVEPARLRSMLETAFAAWPAGASEPAPAPAKPPGARQAVLVEKAGAPQTYVMMGMPGIARSDPDYPAVEVAFQILGGGTASRLFRHLREEKGYTYSTYARADARKLGGSSMVVGSVKAAQTGEALKAMLAEVERLRREPVSAGELEDARNALVLSMPSDFSTAAGIAGRIAEQVIHRLPDDSWQRYAEAVRRVSADDVLRVAQRDLDPARLTTVMVGDPAVVRSQLQGLPVGQVEVRPDPGAAVGPSRVGVGG